MNLEEVIKHQASTMAERIVARAKWSKSEMDLQTEVVKALEPFKKEAGISLEGHHDITIGRGRPDSVYSSVVIEYKKPGRLGISNSEPGNAEAIEQLKQRFEDMEKEERRPKSKIFGVGCDGFRFIFVRYRANDWEISKPVDVSARTVEILLRRLSSLGMTGKALTPDYLQDDFGEGSDIAEMAVQVFYGKIGSPKSARASKLFEQWQVMFREVCGYDLQSPKRRIVNLGRKYGISEPVRSSDLLFAIHSYYAMFMKLLATEIVHFFHNMPTYLGKIGALTGERLKDEVVTLERQGGLFKQIGISNFLEGDLFSWYLDEWDDDVERVMHIVIQKLQEYDPGTLTVEPREARDLLKQLYQYLIDKSVRHDLGEYYTPDWLAELVLERVGYDGNPDKRVLDPACGSGTFLVLAINRIREYAEENMIPPKELLGKILANVVGFDLNPLAVMAARTNYLIALGDLLRYGVGEIPIYLCDSIFPPQTSIFHENSRVLRTSVGEFHIPVALSVKDKIAVLSEVLEHCADNDYPVDAFLDYSKSSFSMSDGEFGDVETALKTMYQRVFSLKEKKIDGIWPRIVKNMFAPIFAGRFDYILGNPPWVNWENLPEDYRSETAYLWKHYGLFPHKGIRARLGSAKDDVSVLMTYVAIDKYLNEGGLLGFVITQTLFKSTGGGEGFRRFEINKNVPIKVISVDDLVELKPFEAAANRTSVFTAKKGEKTSYPVPYKVWKKKGNVSIDSRDSLPDVVSKCTFSQRYARPIKDTDIHSPWITLPKGVAQVTRKAIGKSTYRAREGVNTGGASGVYWIEIIRDLPNGKILIRNMGNVGRRKVPVLEVAVESDLVFPLLRGRDTSKWVAKPSAYVIIPQDQGKPSVGMDPNRMMKKYPKVFSYLNRKEMKRALQARKSSSIPRHPFYSMFGIGDYTFTRYKVVWKEVATDLNAVVIGPAKDDHLEHKTIVPDHTLVLIQFDNVNEAHFVCAVLNSSIAKLIVKSYVHLHASPHVMNYVNVPRYIRSDDNHRKLSRLSRDAHKFAAKGMEGEVLKAEKRIDQLVSQIYGINNNELVKIRKALRVFFE